MSLFSSGIKACSFCSSKASRNKSKHLFVRANGVSVSFFVFVATGCLVASRDEEEEEAEVEEEERVEREGAEEVLLSD